MTGLAPFVFRDKPLHVLGTFDDPEFDAHELCDILEYKNIRSALSRHTDPKDVVKRDTLTNGGKQTKNYVTESGMWALVMRANTPAAKDVQRWVTHEVLPALRKTGQYAIKRPGGRRPKNGIGAAPITPISFRLSGRARGILASTSDLTGVNMTALLEQAIETIPTTHADAIRAHIDQLEQKKQALTALLEQVKPVS